MAFEVVLPRLGWNMEREPRRVAQGDGEPSRSATSCSPSRATRRSRRWRPWRRHPPHSARLARARRGDAGRHVARLLLAGGAAPSPPAPRRRPEVPRPDRRQISPAVRPRRHLPAPDEPPDRGTGPPSARAPGVSPASWAWTGRASPAAAGAGRIVERDVRARRAAAAGSPATGSRGRGAARQPAGPAGGGGTGRGCGRRWRPSMAGRRIERADVEQAAEWIRAAEAAAASAPPRAAGQPARASARASRRRGA